MNIRPILWPHELDALKSLDASFSSPRIFRVERTGHSFALSEKAALPPVRKAYSLSRLPAEILQTDHTLMAERAGVLIGFASMRFELWNRRAMLRHLYISAGHRRSGAGRALVDAITATAATLGARCLWAETQNTNYPAVQFYLRLGFHLCGLDTSMYEISDEPDAEIALFFAKPANAQAGGHTNG